jgi:hypothetical protein
MRAAGGAPAAAWRLKSTRRAEPGAKEGKDCAEVAELADARDSKSREATPRVGSTPTFGRPHREDARPAVRKDVPGKAQSE